MDNISAVLFDFDDTLMATREKRYDALIETGNDLGTPITRDKLDTHWGKPFEELINSIAPAIEYQKFCSHYTKVMEKYEPKVQPGARDVLTVLHSNNIPIFVVSSGSRDFVKRDLVDGELWKYVTRLWGYEDTPAHKPNPNTLSPVFKYIDNLKLRGAATPFIGDSLRDLKVAQENNLPFWAVLTGLSNRSDFQSNGLEDDRILNTLHDLLEPGSEFLEAIEH